MFGLLKKLKPKSTPAEIAATRAQIDVAALEAAHAALSEKRRAALLSGADDGTIIEIERDLDAARLAAERAALVVEDLDRRHAESLLAEKRAADQAKFDAACDKIRAASDAWRQEYVVHAKAIAALCDQMKEANFHRGATLHTMMLGKFECETSKWVEEFDTSFGEIALVPAGDFKGWSARIQAAQNNRDYYHGGDAA